ncbi:bifunctional diguanylate cyclase/phosphodiesterase [Novosphingobium sp. MD-1]|uniref:putative bifunctional diguanylate cyclase/phosphodiesterase n=1 Tax=Novosphingobium sp. MD-1 TaxID=1630648 RepID=UPI00061CBB90|nr:GGDEF and EAL domain-containing protein [Novosphingobium sp. MD-1]GAO56368.1 sensory box/GGDEF family protein [Novosphingobium sp. MD-1]
MPPSLSIQTLPRSLPVMAVLGLDEPVEGDWARLRGYQYFSAFRRMYVKVGMNVLAALFLAFVSFGATPPLFILGWMVLLAAVLLQGMRLDRGLADADRRRLTRPEIVRHALLIVALALIWTLPLVVFPLFGHVDRLALWMVMTVIIAGMAYALAAVPLAPLLFGGIVGITGAVMFVWSGQVVNGGLALAFVTIVSAGRIEAARAFLNARVAEAGMAEKGEVVSLLLREFEEGGADWLWQIDTARRVRAASPRFAFALGCEPDEADGKPLIQLIAGPSWDSGQFHSSLHDLAERLKRRESFSNLIVRVTIDGGHRWWELSASPKVDENGGFAGFRGVGSDVTEQRESSEKIAYLASYDTLTGLPNRMMVTDTLGEAMADADKWRTRCAFLMIDLDRFKAVNDTLGHLVGDQLLALVSERLRKLMTDNELCGRLGGDEFAIVLRDASDTDRIAHVAQAVIHALSQPYQVDSHTLYVGASVGSAIGPRDGATVETLMRNADLALYRAKDSGGGTHCNYEPALHAHAEERRQLEFALRRALERNELHLTYQPVVDATSEQLVSFEALLRWNSAEHGMISPAKFIPLAEDTRLIVPIGEWVLRMACLEAARWPDPIKIAVNVSGEQLLDPAFADTVVSALSASGLPPHRLEIEVTESIFVRDGTTAQATLQRIMALGCGVALDDFGTGYSSLGYLRQMRFSTIKVDRIFVQGAARKNAESLAIVRAVVAMADSLEMSTTAEGVETEEQLAVIRALGCKKIQGYYFGRPMPAEDARALFAPAYQQHSGGAAA